MFSSAATPSPSNNRYKPLAVTALKNAGIIDDDTRMHDASKDKPGGRKGPSRPKVGHRNRGIIDAIKSKPGAASSPLAGRLSESLSIRGAGRPTAVGRMRRDAAATAAGPSRLPVSSRSLPSIDQWREVVNSRYNVQTRFLNLENLAEDPLVKKYHLRALGSVGASSREASVIFKLAGQLSPQPTVLSLARNKLGNGGSLATLAHYLPSLENLSLQNNFLKTFKDIDSIAGRSNKLKNLRELILLNNPLHEHEVAKGTEAAMAYRQTIIRKFDSLEILDLQPVPHLVFAVEPTASTSTSATPAPSATSFPFDMAPSFVFGVEPDIVSGFLLRYFETFDASREVLTSAYAPDATFSFSVVTPSPPRARIQYTQRSKDMPNQRKHDWTPWLSQGSRNLQRIHAGSRAAESIAKGNGAVVAALKRLPKTKHDLTAASKFCLDAWPIPGIGQGGIDVLLVSVHGEFAEIPSLNLNSFDRSLVLAPSLPGSAAQTAGWNITILSDQLMVRVHSSSEAWTPGPMRVQAAETGSTQLSSQPIISDALNAIPEPQRMLVAQICTRTRLNVKYAVDCLENNAWDVQRAVTNFEQVKSTLPPDAYLS